MVKETAQWPCRYKVRDADEADDRGGGETGSVIEGGRVDEDADGVGAEVEPAAVLCGSPIRTPGLNVNKSG